MCPTEQCRSAITCRAYRFRHMQCGISSAQQPRPDSDLPEDMSLASRSLSPDGAAAAAAATLKAELQALRRKALNPNPKPGAQGDGGGDRHAEGGAARAAQRRRTAPGRAGADAAVRAGRHVLTGARGGSV